jgi:hypothetical protein
MYHIAQTAPSATLAAYHVRWPSVLFSSQYFALALSHFVLMSLIIQTNGIQPFCPLIPDDISLQLCTPEVVGVQFNLYTLSNLYLKLLKYVTS